MSQTELAKEIGISQTGLSQALSRGDLKVSLLIKIAQALNVSVGYFFGESSLDNSVNQNHLGIGNQYNAKKINQDLGNKDAQIEALQKDNARLEEMCRMKDEIIEMLKNGGQK